MLGRRKFDFFTKRPKGRSIKNFYEGEALGLGGGAGFGPVFRAKDGGDVVRGELFAAHVQKRAHQDADHVTKEAVAGHFDADEGALFTDGEAAEGADVGGLLVALVFEGAEVVFPVQNLGGAAHPPHIQRRRVPEDERRFKEGPCGAIPDVVAVKLPFRRVAGMEFRVDCFGRADEDVGRQVVIDRPLERGVGQRTMGFEVGHQTQGVHAAVGAGAAVEIGLFLQDARESLFEAFLDRAVLELALPAFVAGALEADDEADGALGVG